MIIDSSLKTAQNISWRAVSLIGREMKFRSWSIESLAKNTGIDCQEVHKVVEGQDISSPNFHRICELLNIGIASILCPENGNSKNEISDMLNKYRLS